jgi:hypothetical protein
MGTNLPMPSTGTQESPTAGTLDGDENRVPDEFSPLFLIADILDVLCEHGFSPRFEDVKVRPMMQGGVVAGVSIDGCVFQRPKQLPPASAYQSGADKAKARAEKAKATA